MRSITRRKLRGSIAQKNPRRVLLEQLEDRRLLANNPFPADFKFDAPTSDMTIGLWVNTSKAQTTDVAVLGNKNWGGGGNAGYVMTMRDRPAGPEWKINNATVGGGRVDGPWVTVDQNEWHHLAFTFNRTTGAISQFTNGVLDSTLSQGNPAGQIDTWDTPLWYSLNLGQDGTGGYAGGQSFEGLVDDAAIWRRALSAAEIQEIFSAGSTESKSLRDAISENAALGNGLVAYYDMDGSLDDTAGAGTPKNGIYRTTGGVASSGPTFVAGLFGQAISLSDLDAASPGGDEYVTLGEAVAEPDSFTGASPANNKLSNPGNWTVDPATFTVNTVASIASGTSQSNPALLEDGDDLQMGSFVVGSSSVPNTFLSVTGGRMLGLGQSDSVIGGGGNVSLVMTGGEVSHYGQGEEGSELRVGGVASGPATVDIRMGSPGSSDSPLIASGPFVVDSSFATGLRRRQEFIGEGPRLGDDIKLGATNGDEVTLEMNGNSRMVVVDVLYPMDQARGKLTVVQNDSSEVNTMWDTRWFDTPGSTLDDRITWTINDSARMLVGRDHNIGEQSGQGIVEINVAGPNALFYAGDRIAIGSGGGNVTVNVTNGLMKVGGNSPGQVINVEETGEINSPDIARDWILSMGSNAPSSNLNVTGGRVEIGRSAYVGIANNGTANANLRVDGGELVVLGVGPIGIGLGNQTAVGVPGTVTWSDNGGDVLLGVTANDVGRLEHSSGLISIARNLRVGASALPGQSGAGSGTLSLIGRASNAGTNSFTVGGHLAFGFDPSAGSSVGSGSFAVVLNEFLSLVNVTGTRPGTGSGNVFIGSDSPFSLSLAAGYRPDFGVDQGVIDLISFNGSIGGFDGVNSVFDAISARESHGIDYSLIYDNANRKVQLNLDRVYMPGDATFSGDVGLNDLAILAANFGQPGNWAQGDFNGDGMVDLLDLAILAAAFGQSDGVGSGSSLAFGLWTPPGEGSSQDSPNSKDTSRESHNRVELLDGNSDKLGSHTEEALSGRQRAGSQESAYIPQHQSSSRSLAYEDLQGAEEFEDDFYVDLSVNNQRGLTYR